MINFLAALGLHCSVWALCSCEQGCPPLPCAGLSFQRLLLLSITASRRRSFRSRSMLAWKLQLSGSRMLAQSLGPMDLFAPLLLESSQTRDWAHVPCIGRPILIHCATREVRKKTFLVLQYRTLKSTVVQHNGRHTGRASGGQASGGQAEELLTGRGSGGGSWSSATEMEGRLQFRSCLMLIAQVLVPCWIQFYLPSWTKDPVILGSSSFFSPLVIDDTVPLDCILNNCYILCTILRSGLVPWKLTVSPPIELTSIDGWTCEYTFVSFTTWRFVWGEFTVSGCHRRGDLARDKCWGVVSVYVEIPFTGVDKLVQSTKWKTNHVNEILGNTNL